MDSEALQTLWKQLCLLKNVPSGFPCSMSYQKSLSSIVHNWNHELDFQGQWCFQDPCRVSSGPQLVLAPGLCIRSCVPRSPGSEHPSATQDGCGRLWPAFLSHGTSWFYTQYAAGNYDYISKRVWKNFLPMYNCFHLVIPSLASSLISF